MAEWRSKTLSLPPGLQEVTDKLAQATASVTLFLDTVARALEAAVAFIGPPFDAYQQIVNALITEIQKILDDTGQAGVYVLVDYPQNLNGRAFNPVSSSNLAGTLVDRQGFSSVTPEDVARVKAQGYNRLQAVASRRRSFNPISQDMIGYERALEHVWTAFYDIADPLRPQFSSSANTFGVVIMTHSTEVATFVKAVSALSNFLAIEDLAQIRLPALQDFVAGLNKPFEDLSKKELENVDLRVSINLRGGGTHPNFIMAVRVRELFPFLGGLLDALEQLVEQLRPNGPITDFIKDTIKALKTKIDRLQTLVDTLADLSKQLSVAFEGTAIACVTIESNTGNNGFIDGLRSSTGYPKFQSAFVCSVLLYTGGPGIAVLKQLFSAGGERIKDSIAQGRESADKILDRPLRKPLEEV